MFDWLIYILLAFILLCAIKVGIEIWIYVLVNKIVNKYGKDINDKTAELIINELCNLNIILKLFIKCLGGAKLVKKNVARELPKALFKFKVAVIVMVISDLITLSAASAFAISMTNIDKIFKSTISSILTTNKKDKICTCYARCIDYGNIDDRTAYELLFGDSAYDEFVAEFDFNSKDMEKINSCFTGKDKAKILIEALEQAYMLQINGSMTCYNICIEYQSNLNSYFRRVDKLDRTVMTADELYIDLLALLADTKTYGRNLDCPVCSIAKYDEIDHLCWGEPHYESGIDWGDSGGGIDTPGNLPSDNPHSGTNFGRANGSYAIQTDDGLSFYWYHQTSYACGCVNCGDWTTMKWGTADGTSEAWHKFGSDGCAVYSLAMIASNLTGREITPKILLLDMGCTISRDMYCDTGPSECFNRRLINREAAAEVLKEKYGIQYAKVNNAVEMDEYLNRGAVIWDQWRDKGSNGSYIHGSHDFTWYANKGHFMVVRGKDTNDNLYCLTSCGNGGLALKYKTAKAVMNSPETLSNVWNHSSGGPRIAFWVDPPEEDESGGGGGGTIDVGGTDWYSVTLPSVSNNAQTVSGQIKLYNGLPWQPVGAYFINTDASTTSLYAYVKSVSGVDLSKPLSTTLTKNGRFCNGVGSWTTPNDSGKTTLNYLRGDGWQYDAQSDSFYNIVDGVACLGVAPPPTIITMSYNNKFSDSTQMWKSASTPSASLYKYGNKKMALVLKDRSGSIKYLPVTTADAKAHTFPGGVCQTNIQAAGRSGEDFKVNVAKTSGDAGGASQIWSLSELGAKLNTETTAGYNPVDYMYNVCETYGWSQGIRNYFNNNFTVVGYIVWE